MSHSIDKGFEPACGYYDLVEYIDGTFVIKGWILVPDKRTDTALLFVDNEFIRQFSILEKEDLTTLFRLYHMPDTLD